MLPYKVVVPSIATRGTYVEMGEPCQVSLTSLQTDGDIPQINEFAAPGSAREASPSMYSRVSIFQMRNSIATFTIARRPWLVAKRC